MDCLFIAARSVALVCLVHCAVYIWWLMCVVIDGHIDLYVCLYPSSILVPIEERSIWQLPFSEARSQDTTAICGAGRKSLPRPSHLHSEEVVEASKESHLLGQDMLPGLVLSMLVFGISE